MQTDSVEARPLRAPELEEDEWDLPPRAVRFLPLPAEGEVGGSVLSPSDLSPDQREAFEQVIRWATSRWTSSGERTVLSLGGYAGTGKTTLVSTISHALVRTHGKSLAFITPTAKAASVLRRKLAPLRLPESTFIGTVHSFMYTPILDAKEELMGWGKRFFKKVENADGTCSYLAKDLPKLDLIVVDECSMVSEDMEQDILALKVPVLAVGDHGQLPPVQGVSSWMASPIIRLEQIHRQAEDNPILALATYVRETGQLPRGIEDFGIPYYRALDQLETPLRDAYQQRGEHEVALLCFTNRLRAFLNREVHADLFGSRVPQKGSQVICLKNNDELINGIRGFITSEVESRGIWYVADFHFPDQHFIYAGPCLQRQFGLDKTPRNIEVARDLVGRHVAKMEELGALFDFGYAMTCHKAQGSQFEQVFVVLQSGRQPSDYPRWLYTAITRASHQLAFCETWSGAFD